MAPQPPAKRRKLDPNEEFKVTIGSGGRMQTVTVARSYLIKSSSFCKTTCDGSWLEGQTKTITLPEADPQIFAIYLQWMYTGKIVAGEEEVPSKDANSNVKVAHAMPVYTVLAELYILGDMLGDRAMRNALIDAFLQVYVSVRAGPGADIVAASSPV